jgi:phage head maturation protease
MRVGNITGMSFGFTVKDDKLERDAETGNVVRTILKLERLYDASPVAFPAYQQTDVGLREEYRAEIESREDYPKEEEQPPVVSDPDDDKAKVNAEQKTLALRISINKNKNA